MLKKMLYILGFLALMRGPASWGIELQQAEPFVGQDLHLSGPELMSDRLSTGAHTLVFGKGLSMSIGANEFSSGSGVVWLEGLPTEFAEKGRAGYQAIVYLGGGVSVQQGRSGRATAVRHVPIEGGRAMVVWFEVSGEVFVTANARKDVDSNDLSASALYAKAVAGLRAAGIGQRIVGAVKFPAVKPELKQPPEAVAKVDREPQFRYPINLAPAGDVAPKLESTRDPNDPNVPAVATVIGRFYMSQKQDERGGLLELQADNAVIFYSTEVLKSDQEQPKPEEALAKGAVRGIYLSGDVLMTKGLRTIRADELYYDFERTKAVVINAEMRSFNVKDGIPIYVRAKELRQVAENKFTAENVTLTTSEFHRPQISLDMSSIEITDTTTLDQQQGTTDKSSYDALMRNVRFKVYNKTLLRIPKMRSNLERPDIPLKSAHVGRSGRWGTMVETRWYLARILGLTEPEGTESTLALDHYSKRGTGGGVDIDYRRKDYFGRMVGYVIKDRGEDKLGRNTARKNLKPQRELRGRFLWQHRQFLPHNWQLTGEISYASDMNFIESFYRNEFNVGKQQETLLHLKRIEDNWGLSFLAKARINDFVNKLEELPTAEFHWTGQSFFGDRLTLYSDTQASRLRQRYAVTNPRTPRPGPQQFFSFATTRNEVDMPLTLGKTKVVPFVAGTVAYEDRMGYFREIDGGMGSASDDVWFGEMGVRASRQPFWRVFPDVKSRKWNLDQLRHLVRPHMTMVGYTQSESAAEQRDIINVGIAQRLQTKRGTGSRRRTVDWMRLNTDATWVNDSGSASAGADRFIWNRPFIPMINTDSDVVPQLDRRSSSMYGVRRNYIGADYSWRVTDTTAILSDMNYDMQSGVVQQMNIGVSRMRWPDLSYYIGSRYLRRITVLDPMTGMKLQEGSNSFVFAITYVLDPRYTVIISQEINFDYGATVGSEFTLLRRYHRMYWGLTFRADESLDERGIVFSIWPQGVPDLAVGPRRYMHAGGSSGY